MSVYVHTHKHPHAIEISIPITTPLHVYTYTPAAVVCVLSSHLVVLFWEVWGLALLKEVRRWG